MNDKFGFISRCDVSRETLDMLEIYAELLKSWNRKINLVSPKTLDNLWTRHFLDSAQVFSHSGPVSHWVDLGSGGGFPGAVVALLAGPEQKTTLIESDQRKAAFLRNLARETSGFEVIAARIEEVVPQEADCVSSRALAPLPELLSYVTRHLKPTGRALLPKGRNARAEMDQALEHWRFDCETYPSETDPEAVILSLGEIERV